MCNATLSAALFAHARTVLRELYCAGSCCLYSVSK
jgi:hypothetical protein